MFVPTAISTGGVIGAEFAVKSMLREGLRTREVEDHPVLEEELASDGGKRFSREELKARKKN